MIVVTQAPPPPPPPPRRVDTPVFQVTLTGVDGSTWDLNAGQVGLSTGPQIFAAPTVDHWWRTSPTLDGARWGGMRAPEKDVTLPVVVVENDWQSWRDADSAFWRAIDPSGECQISVTSPDAVTRTLGLRFVSGGDFQDDGADPLLDGRAAYALEFVAGVPYWRGDTVSRTFSQEDVRDFFAGGNPLFYISSSASFQAATVSNPGDVQVWPRYTVEGPATSWSAGIGDSIVSSQTALTSTQSVTIDTNPSLLTIVDQDGNRVWEQMTDRKFAPVPPGEDIPLNISVAGYTSDTAVSVEFTPLYRRAW